MYDFGDCPDCGGGDGYHDDDCMYDGMDCGYYSSGTCGSGSNDITVTWIIVYIIAILIGAAINELLGAILMIGLGVWLFAK